MKKLIDKIMNKPFIKRRVRKLKTAFVTNRLEKMTSISLVTEEKREIPIIVSLTSYPARLGTLYLTLKSMMRQTVKPNRIILYLDEWVDLDEIPESLIKMKEYGLEIERRKYDLKCHKKYLHAITENPDAIVITIDDDVLYHKKTIEELYKSYQLYPDAVSAKRVHRILVNEDGSLYPYNSWDWLCTSIEKPSYELLATGVGGVLYPPHVLDEKTFDIEKITSLSKRNDDIWLKCVQIVTHTKTVWAKTKHIEPIQIDDVTFGLCDGNVENSQNEIYLSNLEKEFSIDWKTILDN